MSENKKEFTAHPMPEDLALALSKNSQAEQNWCSITPLAQNEFICWVIAAKKPETRARRVKRAIEELLEGQRRPCCWPGCPHRNPKNAKWFRQSDYE